VSATTGRPVRRGWVLAIMCAGMFLVLLDVTVINVALPAISTGLHADLSRLQWIVTAYTITFASVLLAGGTLGDIYGHKRVAMAGLLIFGLASAGCGLAATGGMLIGARAVQGIGAALLLPATLAVITRIFPDRKEQAKALGVWAGISSFALPAGPILGGLLVSAGAWQAVFWINIPVVAVALALTARMIPATRGAVGRRVDIPGLITGGSTLAAVVFAVINVGNEGMSPATLIAIGVGISGAALFVVIERRVEDPALPLSKLRSRAFIGANVVAGAMNFVGIGTIFILTLYLQDIRHFSPLMGGLALLPLFFPLAVLSPVAGRLTARFGPRLPMSCGLLLGAAGSACLLLLTPTGGYLDLLPLFLGLGVGMGLLNAAVVSAAMRSVPADQAGLGSSVNNTARQAAGALGTAVYGVIAGDPKHPEAFVAGTHTLGILGASVWILGMLVTVITLRPAKAQKSAPLTDQLSVIG
jgi:MFS transporter, DHA2 family, methylenomycin A resistance protein